MKPLHISLLASGTLALISTTPAYGAEAPSKDQCFDAHERGQASRKDGKIREAKEHFAVCGHDKCPKLVREDCRSLAEAIKDAVPRLTLKAKDESGNFVSDLRVTINGQPAPPAEPDGSILMDVGEVTVRLESGDGRHVEKKLTLAEGQKLEWIGELPPPEPAKPTPAPPPPAESSSVRPFVYVLGGVAIVGVGGFAAFGLSGRSKQSDMDSCKPDCSRDDVDSMRTSYLLADISLGVAVVAGGAAAYLYFSGNKKGQESVSYLSASPTPRGGKLNFGGTF